MGELGTMKPRRQFSALVPVLVFAWMGINIQHYPWAGVPTTMGTVKTITDLIGSRKPLSAQSIVEDAYGRTFATIPTCQPNRTFQTCLKETQRLSNDNSSGYAWPWWFHTMIRDASRDNKSVFGFWHNLTFENPNLHFCAIEKIGTKHWRMAQCKVNRPGSLQSKKPGQPCPADSTRVRGNASSVVFLRDPLERFLSGFLDKCVSRVARKWEPHCEPLEVFKNDKLLEGIFEDKKIFFEAYVDTMPLKWNMHFFPQSIYCDGLYRHIENYDFVGRMGSGFYDDVHELGMQFPDTDLTQVLDEVFQFKKKLVETGGSVGVETSAASYVEEYYTPRTVRRVLEYFASDYVLLNISIPTWAQEMLEMGG